MYHGDVPYCFDKNTDISQSGNRLSSLVSAELCLATLCCLDEVDIPPLDPSESEFEPESKPESEPTPLYEPFPPRFDNTTLNSKCVSREATSLPDLYT